LCARYYSNQNVEGGGDNATSLVSVSQSLSLATLSFCPIISCNVALGGTSSTLDSDTISNEFLTNGTNSHKNAVVAVRAFAQRVSGLQGFTGKLLGSEKTQVVARSPSRAACARNRANVVLRGVHLQILYSGIYDQRLLLIPHLHAVPPVVLRKQLSHLRSTRELLHRSGRLNIYQHKHRDFKQR